MTVKKENVDITVEPTQLYVHVFYTVGDYYNRVILHVCIRWRLGASKLRPEFPLAQLQRLAHQIPNLAEHSRWADDGLFPE